MGAFDALCDEIQPKYGFAWIVVKTISIQRGLSRWQRYPVIGIFPSVLKLGLGLTQIVVGAIAFVPERCISGDWFNLGLMLMCFGGISTAYAIGNIVTLSFVGWYMEKCGDDAIEYLQTHH